MFAMIRLFWLRRPRAVKTYAGLIFATVCLFFISGDHAGTKRPVRKIFRVFIDAGHTRLTNHATGIIGPEYKVTYELSRRLAKKLAADPRFEAGISRDGDFYPCRIKKTVKSHQRVLKAIVRTSAPPETRSRNLSFYDHLELYGVRFFCLENRYDLLVSIHFNLSWPGVKGWKNRRGFHLIVSPYNRKLTASLTAARLFKKTLARHYGLDNRHIMRGRRKFVPSFFKHLYSLEALRKEGIAVRSLVILGDAFEAAYFKTAHHGHLYEDVPSVLVECGYVHNPRFCHPAELDRMAGHLYEAIIKIAHAYR